MSVYNLPYHISIPVLLLIGQIHAFAMNPSGLDSKMIKEELYKLDSLLFLAPVAKFSPYTLTLQADSLNRSINEWVGNQRRVINANTGLIFTAGYHYRFGDSVSDTYDDELIAYNNRLQFTLSWDMTQSFLFDQRVAYERAGLLGESRRYALAKEMLDNRQEEIIRTTSDCLNGSYNRLISCKRQLLQLKSELQRSLKDVSKILDIDMALVQQQIVMLNGLAKPHNGTTQISFDLDGYMQQQHYMDKQLVHEMIQNHFDYKKLELDYDLLENERRSQTYIRNIKIAPFVRGNLYSGDRFSRTKSNVNAGITVSLPLDNAAGAKRGEIASRMELNRYQAANNRSNLTYEYEQLIQDINQNYIILESSAEALSFAKNKLSEAKKLFDIQKIYLQQVIEEYARYIDMLLSMHDLIGKREVMMVELNRATGIW